VLAAITAAVWLAILVGLVRRGRRQEVPA
jgi:hypothetical protein